MTWLGTYLNLAILVRYTTYCNKGVSKSVEYYCHEQNISAICDGTYDGAIISRCPFRIIKPTCSMLYTDNTASCDVTSYNSMTTTCQCVVSFSRTNSLAHKPSWHFTRPGSRRLLSGSSTYQFSSSELNYLSYSVEYIPSSSILTVKQTFIGLDSRDFDSSAKFTTNGKVIRTGVSNSIGLTINDVTLISVINSNFRRQLLTSSATVTYTISLASSSASVIKAALTKATSDGTLANNLIIAALSLGIYSID